MRKNEGGFSARLAGRKEEEKGGSPSPKTKSYSSKKGARRRGRVFFRAGDNHVYRRVTAFRGAEPGRERGEKKNIFGADKIRCRRGETPKSQRVGLLGKSARRHLEKRRNRKPALEPNLERKVSQRRRIAEYGGVHEPVEN